jgi:hypothetical protein
MKNIYSGKNRNQNIYLTLMLLGVCAFIWFAYNPLGVTYASNWIRVTVTDPSGNKLQGVFVQLEKMNNVFIEKDLYTDNYGEATFKGSGTDGAWPAGVLFDGYVQCGGTIKSFSGTTSSGNSIVGRSIVCPCAGLYDCSTPITTPTTTLGNNQPSCESYGYYTSVQAGKTCTQRLMGGPGWTCYDCMTPECTEGATKFTYSCQSSTQNRRDFYNCLNGKWMQSANPDIINCVNGLYCVNGVDGCEGEGATTTTLGGGSCTMGDTKTLSCSCLDALSLKCQVETCQCNYYQGQYTNCHYTGPESSVQQCQYLGSGKVCQNNACVAGSTFCPASTSKTTQTCSGTAGVLVTSQTCKADGSAWEQTNSVYQACASGKFCSNGLCVFNADSCENHGWSSSGSITSCTRHDVEGVGWCYSDCNKQWYENKSANRDSPCLSWNTCFLGFFCLREKRRSEEMKAIEAVSVLALMFGIVFVLYPQETGGAIDQIINPKPMHYAQCDVLLKRELGNPWIDSYTCSTGAACGGLAGLTSDLQTNIGDYAGSIELKIGDKSQSGPYTIGLGVPFASANTQLRITKCVTDGSYPAKLTLFDGSGFILDKKEFTINTQ